MRGIFAILACLLFAGSAYAAPFSLTSVNGPTPGTFPYIGGIVGLANSSDDIGTGSYNYVYIGGTTFTAPGAGPASGTNSFTAFTSIAENIESSIWSIDGSSLLTAQWINTNFSSPPTFLVMTQGVLLLTGDVTVFSNTFGSTIPVTLTYVPDGQNGFILVKNATNSADLGYLANYFNSFGEYGALTQSTTNALSVSIPHSDVPEPSSFSLLVLGGAALLTLKGKATRS